MQTEILTSDEKGLTRAAEILRAGETVAFPTETVYGLGADATNSSAVEKIFIAKGRPSDNPLIVHIAEKEALFEIVREIPEKAELLMKKFWPGPLTIIMKKSEKIPASVSAGLDTVGVRMPESKVARDFIRLSGRPVAAPSANISGRPSPTTFQDVCIDMKGRAAAILEGEPSKVGVESTVIDMTSDIPTVLRPGGVTLAQLKEVIGEVDLSSDKKDSKTPKAPGMKYRHYAPKARVYILKGTLLEVKEFLEKKKGFVGKIGVLCFDEMVNELSGLCETVSLGKMNCPEDAAKRLFSALRKMDELGANLIFAPEIPEDGLWLAVKNRLYKAAGGSIIDVKNTKALLFICMGNTCRSPMAEGIFAQVNKNVIVSSAGLSAGGEGANEKAILAAKKLGADISSHKSKTVRLEMLKAADVVVTMTESIKAVLPFPEKTVTLYELAGESGDIADPYGQSQEVYDTCAREIKRLAEKSMKL